MKLLKPLLLCICLSAPLSAWAGCKSDCSDEYESAREDCVNTNDDPDDADDLQMCIDGAKSDYDSCIQECDS